jgi:hypothetical protein
MQLGGPKTRSNERADAHAALVADGNQAPRLTRRSARLVTLAVATAAVLLADPELAGWLGSARAQQLQRLAISVAPVVRAGPASRVHLLIQVGPPDALAKNNFIRIRGLPPAAALSAGHVIAAGAWAVPIAELPTLAIILPVGLQGESSVAISLVNVDGDILAEANMVLAVSPPTLTARQESPPAYVGLAVRAPSPDERERALSLHAKGNELLKRGNVFAARKFFERASEAGLAESAVVLAGTYDPDELAKIQVVGLQPDIEAARKWYEKARELGAVEASERLRRLEAR